MSPRAVKVAIADTILGQLIELPKPIAKKVTSWIEKFQSNPAATGLNFERIQKARDPKLRSVRVDRDYRAIVAAPESGDVYLLVYLDKHDDAYRWAEHARVEIHPATGELQVFRIQGDASGTPAPERAQHAPRLFENYRDRDFVRLGLPESLVADVRSIETEEDFLDRVNAYPKLAWDALAGLAEGKSVEEVYAEQGRTARAVDPSDFGAALETPETKTSFLVATDDEELRQVLLQPLERWRIFLHPAQQRLVSKHWSGPVRVLGGAGTGKTVVAMHRARWLARHVATVAKDRILVTTFTQNLASDIRENLNNLCSTEEFGRIDVAHLHGWAAEYLRAAEAPFETVYDEDRLDEVWRLALRSATPGTPYDIRFYKAEWQEIVVANDLADEAAYLRAPRTGRGVPLNRLQRKQMWPVFSAYREEMGRRGWRDGDDALNAARALLTKDPDQTRPYRSVVVDETQDLGLPALRLIRAMVSQAPDDVFLVGDGHQRIYRRRVALGSAGLDIRGRGRHLRINYRTPDEVRRVALAVLEGVPIDDLDGGADSLVREISFRRGAPPSVNNFADQEEELAAAALRIKSLTEAGANDAGICVAVRTNREADAVEDALGKRGLYVHKLSRRRADIRRRPGIRVATMHRVKGLEFDHVLILGVSHHGIPNREALIADDEQSRREAEWRERALLYVAMTRARHTVWISFVGEPSRFIQNKKESQ